MAKIELLLGGPTSAEREEQIEGLIYDLNVCRETAVNIRVRSMIEWFAKENPNKQNYIDLVASVEAPQPVKLPRIGFGTYRHNGFIHPKMVIHGFHMTEIDTSEARFIGNKIIDRIGLDIEDVFEIEYWGFQRVGKVVPTKLDVIYHLGERPHIYHSGQFIAVVQRH
jgi:hypothetical protein